MLMISAVVVPGANNIHAGSARGFLGDEGEAVAKPPLDRVLVEHQGDHRPSAPFSNEIVHSLEIVREALFVALDPAEHLAMEIWHQPEAAADGVDAVFQDGGHFRPFGEEFWQLDAGPAALSLA